MCGSTKVESVKKVKKKTGKFTVNLQAYQNPHILACRKQPRDNQS